MEKYPDEPMEKPSATLLTQVQLELELSQIVLLRPQLLPQLWCGRLWVDAYHFYIDPPLFLHRWQSHGRKSCGPKFSLSQNRKQLELVKLTQPNSKLPSVEHYNSEFCVKPNGALPFSKIIYLVPTQTWSHGKLNETAGNHITPYKILEILSYLPTIR